MKIGIAGYTGRVGQLLVKELQSGAWDGLELAAGGCRALHPEHAAMESFPVMTDIRELMEASDCVVDFTVPDNSLSLLEPAIAANTALVIGTTGIDYGGEMKIAEAARKIPVVYAANMSVGVTLLTALVEQAAAKLGDGWDIEIFEAHHKGKADAPSGTALALGRAAQKHRPDSEFATSRNHKRKDNEIGYAVARGGDVVGEHMVTFYGMGERLELGHRATDRALFARGALRAAQWIGGKPAGLYSMRDVLGL